MKTKEQIEQLAIEEYKNNLHDPFFAAAPMGYIKGYTQCQEDMADKKYNLDDMKKACACGIDFVCEEGLNDFQPFADLINSLNKQD